MESPISSDEERKQLRKSAAIILLKWENQVRNKSEGQPLLPSRAISHGSVSVQVLMAKRARHLRAFPNIWAFIGGGIEYQDFKALGYSEPKAEKMLPSLHPWSQEHLQIYQAAAVREFFEETRVLLIPHEYSREQLEELHSQLPGSELWELLQLSPSELRERLAHVSFFFAGEWITPPFLPYRYATAYFLLPLPSHVNWLRSLVELPPATSEADQLAWQDPEVVVTRFHQLKLEVNPPVLQFLRSLQQLARTKRNGIADLSAWLQQQSRLPIGLAIPIELTPGIQSIPFLSSTLPPAKYTNLVVFGTKQLVLVDPGANPRDQQRLRDILLHWTSVQKKEILAVFLTHYHLDHLQAVPLVHSLFPEVPIYVHPLTFQTLRDLASEENCLSKHETQIKALLAGKLGDLTPFKEVTASFCSLELEEWIDALVPLSFPFSISMGEDPYFSNPWELRALETPGHTEGHVSILDTRYKAIAVGDLVAGKGTVLISPFHGGNMSQYLKSLRDLQKLHPSYLYPAHGPLIKSPEQYLEKYLTHRLWREQRILHSLASSPRRALELEELTALAYQDLEDPSLFPLAVQSTLAHLFKLEKEHKVRREKHKWVFRE